VDGRQKGRADQSRPGERQEVEVVVEEVEAIRLLHGPGDVERFVHLGGDLRVLLVAGRGDRLEMTGGH
jgi:hypothetical protein